MLAEHRASTAAHGTGVPHVLQHSTHVKGHRVGTSSAHTPAVVITPNVKDLGCHPDHPLSFALITFIWKREIPAGLGLAELSGVWKLLVPCFVLANAGNACTVRQQQAPLCLQAGRVGCAG